MAFFGLAAYNMAWDGTGLIILQDSYHEREWKPNHITPNLSNGYACCISHFSEFPYKGNFPIQKFYYMIFKI